jgi:hypothetical protein
MSINDERRRVTGTRFISGKLSRSRNDDNLGRSLEAHTCHWCREPFRPGQMRYPVMTDTSLGWALASLCMDCFKCASTDETHEKWQARYERDCDGCGEPMLTPIYKPFNWQVCSKRCYQRARRKRKQWYRDRRCEACKRRFKPSGKDARFCSNKCRQWQYRRRRG